jgi:deoxyxylulose-5-phosphate synthase
MDERIIRQLLKYREVFIFDAYATSNGFIFALTNRLVELGYRGKIITQAPKDDFYTQDSVTNQMRTAKVDAESITKAIKRRLRHYDQ